MGGTAGEILDGILGETHMLAVGTETDMETAGTMAEVLYIVPHHTTIIVGIEVDTTVEVDGEEAIIVMAITTMGEVTEVFVQQVIMETIITMFNIEEAIDTIELPIAQDNE